MEGKLKLYSFLLFLFFLSKVNLLAQDDENNKTDKHEVKINGTYLIAGIVELSYEYLLNDESSIGLSGFLAFDNDVNLRNGIVGYYRFYFGKKYASGFFAEGFGMLNTQRENVYIGTGGLFQAVYEEQSKTNFALGIAVGGKFTTRKGLVLEIYGGVGRNLGGEKEFEIVPRAGITIGKRF